MPLRETRSHFVSPVLEIGRVAEEESVEKRAAVRSHRAREVARLERSGELSDVRRDDRRIESKLGRAQEERVGPEFSAQAVKKLRQSMSRLAAGASGQSRETILSRLIPRDPAAASSASRARDLRWAAAPPHGPLSLPTERLPRVWSCNIGNVGHR